MLRSAFLASLRLLLLVSCTLGATSLLAQGRAPKPIDHIVAVVNTEVITRHELDEHIRVVVKQLERQGTKLPPRDALEKQLLERLITERVQLQFAKETGLRVDDAVLDRTLARIAQENRLGIDEFRRRIEADGVNFRKFREEIRAEIIMARLREREVDNKIVVTEAELQNYLSTQATQTGGNDEYNLAHILVRIPEQASPEQIQERRRKAESALAQLREGASFAQVAAGSSDSPDATQGGAMGWRPAARLPALFVEALARMKIGDVSAVLRSPAGFHIIKLVDKRGSGSPTMVTKTSTRHILIKTSELVSDTDAENRLLQLKERIDNGEDFAELARLHSQDASASNGGDIGWMGPGETVPEFEKVMNELKPGQVSGPVRSPFGWHLIQVVDRRTEDVSAEKQKLEARQAIRARKADDAYQEWLRQLRDRAYVEYRTEER